MRERIDAIFDWLKQKFSEMDGKKKIITIVAGVLFVAILTISILVLSTEKYVVLNKGLSEEQSGKITAKLDELNIKWQIEQAASTILVPEKDIDQARMKLAIAGFSGPSGFSFDDLLSKMTFSMSASDKNKLYLQYQKSALENSLKSIEAVEDATVILNIKESSTFLNLEDDVSSVSAVLKFKEGMSLKQNQVEGMVSLIRTAVKNLDRKNITIVDQNSVKLNKTSDFDDDGFSTESQDGLKVSVEKRFDYSLREFLSNIYGENNIDVKTSVKLDFDKSIKETEKFTTPKEGADEGLLRSVIELKENVVNKSIGGAPGTDTNTTETPQFPAGDKDGSSYQKTQNTLNYELNKVQTRVEKAKGQIVNVSVGIVINKKALKDEKMSEEDEKKLGDLVKAAIGVNETIDIKILTQEFFEEPTVELEPAPVMILGMPIWLLGVIVLILAGTVFFVFKSVSKTKKKAEEIVEEIETEQREFEEIDLSFEDKSSPKYQIEKFIEERPEIVAQLLRSWMYDD